MSGRFQQGNFGDARIVRTRVFMEEQGFANEFDALDKDAHTIHVTAYDDAGALVGCARTFPDPDHPAEPGRWVFGRLAVLPEARGGWGEKLLAEAERLAHEAGATEMHLHAQCYLTSFYERRGYEQYGEVELDEHVEHIWMKKAL